MLRNHLITLFVLLFLSGCMGIYEGGFECPPGRGMGCTSISEVNKSIDQSIDGFPQQTEGCSCKKEERLQEEEEKPFLPRFDPQIWYSPWCQDSESQEAPPLPPIPKDHGYGSI